MLLSKIIPNDPVAVAEISGYLCESFGDRQRIDYGTGHELNFLWVLLCLRQVGLLREEDDAAAVLVVFVSYLQLMRKLQFEYWLEPAGSHGINHNL